MNTEQAEVIDENFDKLLANDKALQDDIDTVRKAAHKAFAACDTNTRTLLSKIDKLYSRVQRMGQRMSDHEKRLKVVEDELAAFDDGEMYRALVARVDGLEDQIIKVQNKDGGDPTRTPTPIGEFIEAQKQSQSPSEMTYWKKQLDSYLNSPRDTRLNAPLWDPLKNHTYGGMTGTTYIVSPAVADALKTESKGV